jgi:hypothetical protein
MFRFLLSLLFISITSSCSVVSTIKDPPAELLRTYPISSSNNANNRFQYDENRLFFVSDGELFSYDFTSGKELLRFGNSVARFDIQNGILLVEELNNARARVTSLNATSFAINWQYEYQENDDYLWYVNALIADSLVLIQDSSLLTLNAFDAVSGQLVWKQPELEGYYLGRVKVKDEVIVGEGGIQTTTTAFTYRRDIHTGGLIGDIDLCGLGCRHPGDMVFFEYEGFEYSYFRDIMSAVSGVTQRNLKTDERTGCSFDYLDATIEPGTEDYPFRYRIIEIFGNDKKLLMTVDRSDTEAQHDRITEFIYMMPPCDSETKDSVFPEKELLFGIKQSIPWSHLIPISDTLFITQLVGSTDVSFMTLKNSKELIEIELAGLPILAKGIPEFESINGIDGYATVLEVRGTNLVSLVGKIFQITDINTRKILLRSDIGNGAVIQYITVGKYLIVHTTGGISVIGNPLGLSLN